MFKLHYIVLFLEFSLSLQLHAELVLNMNTAAKFLILLVVVLFSADNVITKVYDPCDLAKEMVEKHRFTKTDIADCKFRLTNM